MKRCLRISLLTVSSVAALAVVSLCSWDSQASEMSVAGKSIWLRGHIVAGDQDRFRDLIASARSISTVHLDSPGGDIYSAGEIARQIRLAGLSTVVDASRQVCASSCTIIFVGGVKRIYLNADRVGGLSTGRGFKGLGFHEATYPGQSGTGNVSSAATALMISLYGELGVPAAGGLVAQAPPQLIYGVSAETALKLGIATSR